MQVAVKHTGGRHIAADAKIVGAVTVEHAELLRLDLFISYDLNISSYVVCAKLITSHRIWSERLYLRKGRLGVALLRESH